MRVPYYLSYDEPFPMLRAFLRTENARLGPFEALLDSGADGTFVPHHLLKQIGAERSSWVIIRTHFEQVQRLPTYVVDVQVNDILLPGVFVVAHTTNDEIIVGRNVLNKLSLFLDGPALTTDLLDDATVKRLRARRAPP